MVDTVEPARATSSLVEMEVESHRLVIFSLSLSREKAPSAYNLEIVIVECNPSAAISGGTAVLY